MGRGTTKKLLNLDLASSAGPLQREAAVVDVMRVGDDIQLKVCYAEFRAETRQGKWRMSTNRSAARRRPRSAVASANVGIDLEIKITLTLLTIIGCSFAASTIARVSSFVSQLFSGKWALGRAVQNKFDDGGSEGQILLRRRIDPGTVFQSRKCSVVSLEETGSVIRRLALSRSG